MGFFLRPLWPKTKIFHVKSHKKLGKEIGSITTSIILIVSSAACSIYSHWFSFSSHVWLFTKNFIIFFHFHFFFLFTLNVKKECSSSDFPLNTLTNYKSSVNSTPKLRVDSADIFNVLNTRCFFCKLIKFLNPSY